MFLEWKFGPNFLLDDNASGTGGTGGTQEHPVSAPWAEAQGVWNIGEGDKAQPWWTTLPDEVARNHIAAKQYANPAELALANYNLTRLQTGDPTVLAMPGADATPEQMRSFYEKLGAPKEATGYELKFGDGVTVDEGMVKFGQSAFHKAGLTPQQAQTVADEWNAFAAEQQAAYLEQDRVANEQALAALSTKWGADLDKNKAAGQRVVQALGLPNELIQRVEGAIGSAAIVELLATIGRKSDEGGFTAGNGGGDPNNPANMTKEQAAARIQQLQGDVEFQKKYGDKNHPGHAEALQLMERLFARI